VNALRLPTAAVAVALLALVAGAAPADEPTVSVNVRADNIVEVRVVAEDGAPGAGFRLKLVDADGKVLADGHSNDQGRWEWFLPERGVYRVLCGPQQFPVRVDVRETVAPTGKLACCLTNPWDRPAATTTDWRVLWLPIGLAIAMLTSGGLVFVVSRVRGKAAPPAPATSEEPPSRGLAHGHVAFLSLLLAAGLGLAAWTGLRAWKPAASVAPTSPDAPRNLAEDVRDYLRARKIQPLSGKLDMLLRETRANKDRVYVRTQANALLTEPAPDFTLKATDDKSWNLQAQLKKGPVVLIFYYGYNCNHCVSQLFDVNQDVAYFRELGAEVVAISADPVETTRDRYREFGAFGFPVLSDPGNEVARKYAVFTPPPEGKKVGSLMHGTFVIDREGIVQWAYEGDEPFTGNRTLLYKLAELEDRLPDAK